MKKLTKILTTALALPIFAALGLAALPNQAQAQTQAVTGYVDLHSHLAGEQAFGGGWFWGTVNGPMETAVQRCDGNFLTKSHAATIFPVVSEFLGADTGWHLFKRRGYDRRQCKKFLGITIPGTCPEEHFEHWPKWDAIAHQQMWNGWLKQAHQGGLRVMVVSLYESNFLCMNTAWQSRRYSCDEMESVKRQATFTRNFANANSSWVGIAETPAQARQLIAQGKLALVLAVEATKLFPSGDYLAQLDELRALGVRSVQLTHHADNRFSGAAPIPKLMQTANLVEFLWGANITDINAMVCRDSFGNQGSCNGANYLNERGLTNDGNTLLNAMMSRGMLLDVSHMSRKAFAQTYQQAMARGSYPLIYSHTHMWDTIAADEEHHEKFITASEIQMINNTGGMIGLRTGPEDTNNYGSSVANQCQGSSRSFAQSLMYAVDQGLSVGFGADFNGFITQMKPRYRIGALWDPQKTCHGDTSQLYFGAAPNEFQKKGLAHVGLLPALMTDLSAVGTPTSYLNHLNRSAEKFIQIWERSVALSSGNSTNLALSASASASSTYCSGVGTIHCYSPARINDGNAATTLGGFTSWSNNAGQAMPQWVRLDWSNNINATRFELYTSTGYELQNFVIQYLTPQGNWQNITATPAFPTNNSSTHISFITNAPVNTTSIRVLAQSGSAAQAGYARVNELEVY